MRSAIRPTWLHVIRRYITVNTQEEEKSKSGIFRQRGDLLPRLGTQTRNFNRYLRFTRTYSSKMVLAHSAK